MSIQSRKLKKGHKTSNFHLLLRNQIGKSKSKSLEIRNQIFIFSSPPFLLHANGERREWWAGGTNGGEWQAGGANGGEWQATRRQAVGGMNGGLWAA